MLLEIQVEVACYREAEGGLVGFDELMLGGHVRLLRRCRGHPMQDAGFEPHIFIDNVFSVGIQPRIAGNCQ